MERVSSGILAGLIGLTCMHYARSATLLARGRAPRLRGAETAATAALARGLYRLVSRREPSRKDSQRLSKALHGALGVATAVVYAQRNVGTRALSRHLRDGALLGLGMWTVGDELIAPVFHLSRPPWQYPAATHWTTFAGHMGYGLGTGFGIWLTHFAGREQKPNARA